ncbi:MAG: anhydro-N-acetylmuramic acid kinase, partial [Planctomycetota bacterium]
MKHPYLKRKPPKSTGRETFGRQFLNKQLKSLKKASKAPQDWIATATAFTARSIAHAYRRFLPGFDKSSLSKPKVAGETKKRTSKKNQVILTGGGAHNPTLMAMLSAELPGFTIRTIESFGMPASAKEAVSFAILAAACIDGIPANMPQATGANRKAVIGRIVLP